MASSKRRRMIDYHDTTRTRKIQKLFGIRKQDRSQSLILYSQRTNTTSSMTCPRQAHERSALLRFRGEPASGFKHFTRVDIKRQICGGTFWFDSDDNLIRFWSMISIRKKINRTHAHSLDQYFFTIESRLEACTPPRSRYNLN